MNRILVGALVAIATLAVASSALAAGERSRGNGKFVPREVVVKFKDSTTAEQRSQARDRARTGARRAVVRGVGAKVLRVRGGVRAAVARLERSRAVRYAEPNFMYRAQQATPNDPRFGELWGLNNTGQTGGTPDADIDAPEGWDNLGLGTFPATGGAKVGIVDTGILRNHQEFAGRISDCGGVNNFGINLVVVIIGSDPRIVDNKCHDDNGHGTHVAGTIGATANNGVGVAGVAFNSPLAICKALSSSGSGTLVMVANCINWVNQRGADIISMSLGATSGAATLQAAVRNATNNGSLLVAAAGNSGNSSVSYPAGYPEVVSVAATNHNDQRASFSQFNADVEVAAPGVDVLSTFNDGGYRTGSGTSMATPHASGVAAQIAATNRAGGPAAWRAELDNAVDDLGPAGRDPQFGFGRVNLSDVTP